jgi:hypothetical protein
MLGDYRTSVIDDYTPDGGRFTGTVNWSRSTKDRMTISSDQPWGSADRSYESERARSVRATRAVLPVPAVTLMAVLARLQVED